MIQPSPVLALLLPALLLLGGADAPSPPAPDAKPATGVIEGVLHAQGQPAPAEIVIYLEPTDPSKVHFPPPEKRVRISQKGAQFSPAFSVVAVGQTVEFLNDEDRAIEHNVYSNAPTAPFDFGLFPRGQSRVIVFDQPGPVTLLCSIHRFMDGVVYVSPTPLFSRLDADGHYRIDGIPPGEYTLKTWQRRRRFPEQSIAVKVDDGARPQTINVELHRK